MRMTQIILFGFSDPRFIRIHLRLIYSNLEIELLNSKHL